MPVMPGPVAPLGEPQHRFAADGAPPIDATQQRGRRASLLGLPGWTATVVVTADNMTLTMRHFSSTSSSSERSFTNEQK